MVRTGRVEVKRLTNMQRIEVGCPRLHGAREETQLKKRARVVFAVRERNQRLKV
jgi:hypothetical protein